MSSRPPVSLDRLRGLVQDRLHRLAGEVAPAASAAGAATGPEFARNFGPAPLASEGEPVTNLLYERLSPEDVQAVERAVEDSEEFRRHQLSIQDPALRRWLILAWGVWLGVDGVSERTGLPSAQPPEHIHAMARGPLSAAGGLYEANLVVDALASVGYEIADASRALDFGCSSGRVLRVLRAAYPEVAWSGCDPNREAVSWAGDHLEGIEFFASPQHPPLEAQYGSLDFVYAISIWSHFAPELGLRWFDEMHRLLKPGGYLVLTTHGLESVAYYSERGLRSAEQSREIAAALYRDGFWYAPEFGTAGDWGVVNQSWGTCFLSPEWMLGKLCPLWRVREFAAGRNQANQDVYVLQRG